MPLKELAERRNLLHQKSDAAAIVNHALNDLAIGKVGLVSSFGAESVVLLHMISEIDRDTPVIFIDTEMLFDETLRYQRDLSDQMGLSDIRVITPSRGALMQRDVDGILHKFDPDACCTLRKTEPLKNALKDFGGWITGRKRIQGGARARLPVYEKSGRKIKVNPLVTWTHDMTSDYIATHNLPRHPMVAKGFPSIGCTPCTSKARSDEDHRAGRWRGTTKDECGIHFDDGKMMRQGDAI
jgi:phosphoadenosine phosphosulfate reductase